jgi:hypothetical protein
MFPDAALKRDVVRRHIEKLRGRIGRSAPSWQRRHFLLMKLPLILAIIEGFVAE